MSKFNTLVMNQLED